MEIQGGVYNLETGRVDFLGRSPAQAGRVGAMRLRSGIHWIMDFSMCSQNAIIGIKEILLGLIE